MKKPRKLYAAQHPHESRRGSYIFCCSTQENVECSVTKLKEQILEDVYEGDLLFDYVADKLADSFDKFDGKKETTELAKKVADKYSIWEVRKLSELEVKKLLAKEKRKVKK